MEISVNPNYAKGLAIIVTNDYATRTVCGATAYSHLSGTVVDGQRLKDAFEALDFTVRWKRNVREEDLQLLMSEIRGLRYDLAMHYKCIVFVFSGHGETADKLVMQDGKKIDICDHFIAPVLPGEAPLIGSIPKVFIIDACRGVDKTETVCVPANYAIANVKGNTVGPDTCDSQVRKGSHDIPMLSLPKKGNFLVAYSTLPGCIANDYKGIRKGSLWLEVLAKHLPVNRGSIEDVLTDANEELHNLCRRENFEFQQPVKVACLNRRLHLLDSHDCVGMATFE